MSYDNINLKFKDILFSFYIFDSERNEECFLFIGTESYNVVFGIEIVMLFHLRRISNFSTIYFYVVGET